MVDSCKYCTIQNAIEDFILFDDEERNAIISDIYNGAITKSRLNRTMYEKIGGKLYSGVEQGLDITSKANTVLLGELRTNVYVFSAAKTYQQTRQMSSLLIDKDGNRRSFYEFNKDAKRVFDEYNKNYLYAEYNSSISQARAVSLWRDIQADKDLYNQLKYITAGDSRVRPEHRVLDGIIRSVDDKFWKVFFPPNGWNCRCHVQQVMDEAITDLRLKPRPSKEDVPEAFRFNAGVERKVFSAKHPYFDVPKEDKALAKNNFNLPLP